MGQSSFHLSNETLMKVMRTPLTYGTLMTMIVGVLMRSGILMGKKASVVFGRVALNLRRVVLDVPSGWSSCKCSQEGLRMVFLKVPPGITPNRCSSTCAKLLTRGGWKGHNSSCMLVGVSH